MSDAVGKTSRDFPVSTTAIGKAVVGGAAAWFRGTLCCARREEAQAKRRHGPQNKIEGMRRLVILVI
jgi:hypothetical protein